MRDVFAEQIMMICFAIFGRQDIYKFVGDINNLTKEADKRSARQCVWRERERGGESVVINPCKVSTQL